MGTFKLGERLRRCLGQPRSAEPDYVIDNWIREALVEEALLRPSSAAWERLRLVIVERKCKNYGMWVLDEPQRDPPDVLPMLLNGHQYERALRIYDIRGRVSGLESLPVYKDAIWGGIIPTFSVLLNL